MARRARKAQKEFSQAFPAGPGLGVEHDPVVEGEIPPHPGFADCHVGGGAGRRRRLKRAKLETQSVPRREAGSPTAREPRVVVGPPPGDTGKKPSSTAPIPSGRDSPPTRGRRAWPRNWKEKQGLAGER